MIIVCAEIVDAHYGLGKFVNGKPGLWFTLTWHPQISTLVSLPWGKATEFLIENEIYQVEDLNGRICNAQIEGGKVVSFDLPKKGITL